MAQRFPKQPKIIKHQRTVTPGSHLGHFRSKVCPKSSPKTSSLVILRCLGDLWGRRLAPLCVTLAAQDSHLGGLRAPFRRFSVIRGNKWKSCNKHIVIWHFHSLEGPRVTILARTSWQKGAMVPKSCLEGASRRGEGSRVWPVGAVLHSQSYVSQSHTNTIQNAHSLKSIYLASHIIRSSIYLLFSCIQYWSHSSEQR